MTQHGNEWHEPDMALLSDFISPYYVLTKAYAQLVNAKIHPNTGDPNYDVKHEFTDISGIITDAQHGSRGSGLHADSHARLHDHSLAEDGSPIALAGVPDLPASKITSGRFPLARLPDGTLNYLLLGQGAGIDPAYGAFSDTIHGSRGSGLHADSHARLHALDSALDHSGVITDAQHGTRGVNLHDDAHSVYAIISCRVGASVTGTYAVINNSDMLLNISDFPSNAKARLRVTWQNSVNESYNRIQLSDQFGPPANNPVPNSEIAGIATDTAWYIRENTTPFTLPAGLKSFQIQAMVFFASTMTISKIELQIERG